MTTKVTVAGTVPTPPTGTFSVSPRTLGYGGGDITLTWASSNTTEASFDNGIGVVPLSGSRTLTVGKSTGFTLTLKNGFGITLLRDSVHVGDPPSTPTGTFGASPESLGPGGGPVTLSWTSQGAVSATIDQGIGPVALTGDRTVTVTRPTTFTMSLSNGLVTTLLQTTVDVDTTPPPPEGTFTATPSTVPFGGGDATLAWTSTNSTSAFIDQGIGSVPLSGSHAVHITSHSTFNLVLSNAAHQETLTVKVLVDAPPPPLRGVLELAPSALPAGGGEIVLSWSSENAANASIDNGIGSVPLSGTRSVTVDRSLTFGLTLTNETDTLILTRDIVVEESVGPPQGVLAVLPSVLPEGGGEVTLFWSTEKAARVSIDHGVGVVPINGSARMYVGSSSQITLTAENGAGTVRSTASVLVGSSTVRGIPSLAQNPDFEIGTAHWNFQSDGVGRLSAEESAVTEGKAARIDIEQPGTVVQFYQVGIPLEPRTRYRLEFDAWSSTGHDLEVFVHQHFSPFASYGLSGRHLDITTTRKIFSLDFVTENMDGPVSDSRLRFWFGPYADDNDVYWIDNVLVHKLEGVIVPLAVPTVAFASSGSQFLPAAFNVSWSPITGASHYDLQVSRDSLFQVIEFEDSSLIDTVADIGPLEPGTRYFLRVRADAEIGPGPFSPIYAFTTEPSSSRPLDFNVEQNYPNPFNAGTVIRYFVRTSTYVSLKVYDLLGREILTLVDSYQPAGSYLVSLTGSNLASATYFYVFRAGDYRDVRKMILLR